MTYDWKDSETGVVVEHDHWSVPPDLPGDWHRVFKFAVGKIDGAGGSPARSSIIPKEKESAQQLST